MHERTKGVIAQAQAAKAIADMREHAEEPGNKTKGANERA
jgi:hypothetical protein